MATDPEDTALVRIVVRIIAEGLDNNITFGNTAGATIAALSAAAQEQKPHD